MATFANAQQLRIALDLVAVETLIMAYDDVRHTAKARGVTRHPDEEVAKCVIELAHQGVNDRVEIRSWILSAFRLNRL